MLPKTCTNVQSLQQGQHQQYNSNNNQTKSTSSTTTTTRRRRRTTTRTRTRTPTPSPQHPPTPDTNTHPMHLQYTTPPPQPLMCSSFFLLWICLKKLMCCIGLLFWKHTHTPFDVLLVATRATHCLEMATNWACMAPTSHHTLERSKFSQVRTLKVRVSHGNLSRLGYQNLLQEEKQTNRDCHGTKHGTCLSHIHW